MSKHVRSDLLKPAGASCRFAKEVTNHRRHLFANEDPEKPQKRDDRGRRGANLKQAVKNPDRQPHGEADQINFHAAFSGAASAAWDPRAHLEKRTWIP